MGYNEQYMFNIKLISPKNNKLKQFKTSLTLTFANDEVGGCKRTL